MPLACGNAYQLRTLMVGDSCASRGCCALGGCQGVPPARAGAPEPMARRWNVRIPQLGGEKATNVKVMYCRSRGL